jgi:hypothetical protein
MLLRVRALLLFGATNQKIICTCIINPNKIQFIWIDYASTYYFFVINPNKLNFIWIDYASTYHFLSSKSKVINDVQIVRCIVQYRQILVAREVFVNHQGDSVPRLEG